MLHKMLTFILILGAVAAPASAAQRRLTLKEAVELALQVDPLLAEAHTGEERSRLAVLRSQLDRVSIKIDGQLRELWNQSNIGGPTQYYCTVGMFTGSVSDRSACENAGGQVTALGSTEAGQGLLNLQAQVAAPLFTGFRVTSNVRRAQRLEDAAATNIRQVRKDVAIAVARLYWSVRRSALVTEVQRAALVRMIEAEAVAKSRVEAGLAPPIDGNRAQVRRLQQMATLADYGGQQREATAQLAVSLGISDDLELVDAPELPTAGPAPVADLLSSAQHDRPEIQGARLQLEAQHQTVRMAQSSYYPQLSVFGLFQFGNNPYLSSLGASSASSSANPFAGVAGNLTLGAQLTMNFFDTLNTYTSVKDARYEEARLASEQRRWTRVVEADVRQAHAHLERLYEQRPPLVEARALAQDNVTILRARYGNGEALIIELLDAEIDQTNAELRVVDLDAQLQLAWIELQAALGNVVGVQP